MGAIIVTLAMLLGTFACGRCVELTQPGSMVVKPGESVSISCKVTGYSLTDSSYATNWIRQPAGKGLEWIGVILSGGNTYYKDSLKNKFTISRDTSSSTVSLQGSSLQTGDTAVYYCARRDLIRGNGYFDYWGKGTQVTVSSGEKTKPTVFPLLSCGPTTGDYVTVGCMATGFMPDSLTFKWASTDGAAAVSGVIQYPSVRSGDKYTVISQAKVKAADWDAHKSLQCTAEHPAGNVDAPVVMPPKHEQSALVYLMTPSQEELKINKTATFACFASKFAPRQHSFTWLRNDKEIYEGVITLPDVKHNGEKEVYSATSFLHLNESQWRDAETSVSCEFKHKGEAVKTTAVYPTGCISENPVVVTIIPPSNEDLFLHDKVTLSCNITGNLAGIESVAWKREDKKEELVSIHEVDGKSEVYKLKISKEDLANSTLFTCTVEHSESAFPIKRHYRRENGGKQQPPSVFILAPAEQPDRDMVTLTCYAKDFYPKEVLISWLANDEAVKTGFKTTEVIQTGSTYSVYSQFSISTSDWQSGVVYSCVVYHEAAPKSMRTIVRTIDSQSKKPSTVSLNLAIPQCVPTPTLVPVP